METERLRNKLARRILDMQDVALLKKVADLINTDEVVGYEADGTPVHAQGYITEMEAMDKAINNGTLPTLTTDEVRRSILG